MRVSGLLLGFALLGCAGVAEAAGEDDAAWIARYVASGRAPGVALRTEQKIGFDQLSKFVGHRVRVELDNGRERRGIVERVDRTSARLRSQFSGGFFRFTLSRDDVRGIRVD
jgi:hypothetical protein